MPGVVCTLLDVFVLVLFVSIVVSWIPTSPGSAGDRIRVGLRAVTEPLLSPLRAVLPPVRLGSGAALDLSPIVLVLIVRLVSAYLC